MNYAVNSGKGLENIKAWLFDMDGTLYLGNDRLPGALELIDYLHETGRKVFYITNNSSKIVSEYVKKLASMGISATEDEFFTSAQAIVYMLNKEKPGARLFIMGTPPFERFMESEGFTQVREYYNDERRPDYCVLSFDQTLTYDKLRIFCDYITDGVTYVATHPDMVCPAEGNRTIPDIGAFMLAIEGSTGKRPSLVAGKPNPTMINIVAERLGLPTSDLVVVGDRLHTDILSGVNAKASTICVLSGETTPEILEKSPTKPQYVFDSVKEIWEYLKEKDGKKVSDKPV